MIIKIIFNISNYHSRGRGKVCTRATRGGVGGKIAAIKAAVGGEVAGRGAVWTSKKL